MFTHADPDPFPKNDFRARSITSDRPAAEQRPRTNTRDALLLANSNNFNYLHHKPQDFWSSRLLSNRSRLPKIIQASHRKNLPRTRLRPAASSGRPPVRGRILLPQNPIPESRSSHRSTPPWSPRPANRRIRHRHRAHPRRHPPQSPIRR
jgi:hypothetical protein